MIEIVHASYFRDHPRLANLFCTQLSLLLTSLSAAASPLSLSLSLEISIYSYLLLPLPPSSPPSDSLGSPISRCAVCFPFTSSAQNRACHLKQTPLCAAAAAAAAAAQLALQLSHSDTLTMLAHLFAASLTPLTRRSPCATC